MCIRDRARRLELWNTTEADPDDVDVVVNANACRYLGAKACLLYTSDAADERSSVDLGGRRILKKKKQK